MIYKAKAIIILSRPVNLLIAFLSVWAASVIAGDVFISYRIIAASFSAALITAYGNAVNDIFDSETDKINKPFRPLPSGALTRKEAWAAAMIFSVAGLLLSFYIDYPAIAVAFAAVVLLTLYTPIFKGYLFAGNITVALVSSLAFIYGGIAAGKPSGALIPAVFAFLLHLGREMVKDVQDIAADKKSGIRTGASIDNSETARMMAAGVFVLLVIATVIPFLTHHYGFVYFLTVVLGVDLALIIAAIKLLQTDDPEVMRKIAAWLKAVMPIGLLAVLLGSRGL